MIVKPNEMNCTYFTNSANNLNYSIQLGFYLAGLIQGDGNIWTSNTLNPPKGRINNPQVAFTLHKKEKPVFCKLKHMFNTGSLYQEKQSNICKFIISETNKLI